MTSPALRLAVFTLLVLPVTGVAPAAELAIVAYNVESDGARPTTVAGEIEQVPRVDIWAFSEVFSRGWLHQFREAAERANVSSSYRYEIGTTGVYNDPKRGPDYLGFVYDVGRLRLREHYELHHIDDGSHRAPLVADFVLRETGTRFLLVVNHLASGDEDYRAEQTVLLRNWARDHASVPVIMIGDFNYRLDTMSSPLDVPDDLLDLSRGGHLAWIKPSPLRRTWCGRYGGRHNWMYDFAFVNGLAARWQPRSDVLSTYCRKSSPRASDHRPVRLRLSLIEAPPSPGFAVASAAEPATPRLGSREYKLLLKPERFAGGRERGVKRFWKLVAETAEEYELTIGGTLDEKRKRRLVSYLDTDQFDLRQEHRRVVRERSKLDRSGDVVEERKLTLKYRDSELGRVELVATDYLRRDPGADPELKEDAKLEEDVVWKGAQTGLASLFSFSVDKKIGLSDQLADMAALAAVFAPLEQLELQGTVSRVNDFVAREVRWKPDEDDEAKLQLGGGCAAEPSLSFWYLGPESGTPAIAEFSFSIDLDGPCSTGAVDDDARRFLRALGESQWSARSAGTKTQLAYGQQPLRTLADFEPTASTTVILVRHADVPPGHSEQSTSLTPAGRDRAASLVGLATGAGVTALYATQFCRTVQTAEPLAVALELPIVVPYVGQPQTLAWLDSCTPAIDDEALVAPVEVVSHDPRFLVQRILARHLGETVLVVGHSNTVPELIATFGMRCSDCRIEESQFDKVFVVNVSESAPPTLVRARYGPCPCD